MSYSGATSIGRTRSSVGGGQGDNGATEAVAQNKQPLVPIRIAADFMRDEDGRVVLIQVKDVVWEHAPN